MENRTVENDRKNIASENDMQNVTENSWKNTILKRQHKMTAKWRGP